MVQIRGGYSYDPATRQITGTVEEWIDYGDAHPDAARLLAVMIHPGATVVEVNKAIVEQREFNGQRGKNAPDNRLMSLGALRLLKVFKKIEEAKKYANEARTPNGCAPVWAADETWSRAKRKAEENAESVLKRLL